MMAAYSLFAVETFRVNGVEFMGDLGGKYAVRLLNAPIIGTAGTDALRKPPPQAHRDCPVSLCSFHIIGRGILRV